MPSFFTENESFDTLEKLYAPPGASDPGIDSDGTGSSNHANVFNTRLQILVNRTAWLRKFFTAGRLKSLLDFDGTANKGKVLGFDSGGGFGAFDFPISLGMVRMSAILAGTNPFQDDFGYWWFIPDGTPLTPAQTRHERLYKAVWGSVDPATIVGGKGTSADSDWNTGKNINYPDCRDDFLHMRSGTRGINRTFGTREVTLVAENFKHRHNLSLQGFTASSISTQQSEASTVYHGIPFGPNHAAGTSKQNVAGNRVTANDAAGAIWENTTANAAPITTNPPGISFEMMIYLGYRY